MMEHSYDIGTKLTQIIYDYYVDSSDYNGLELCNLTVEYDTDTVVNALVRLIEENKIALIASAHDENPHIIRFGFPSIDEQICYLQSNRLDGYACLYPTETYLKENRDTQDVVPRYPFIHMIELGYPQLKACYFEWGILYKYFSDPRYKFHFSDYIGSISSTDAVDDNSIVNIKTFGIGKDENNNRVVVAFPRDLIHMSYASQIEWYSKLISNQNGCKILDNYIRNLFEGCWAFPQTVYESIIQEISNIIALTTKIWDHPFFRKDFIDSKPIDFDMIYIPTYKVYMDYVSLLEKVVINNIDVTFFKSIGWNTIDDKGKTKGNLCCLKEWLHIVNSDIEDEITSPLRDLRKLRQNPAHKIEKNRYDIEFLNEQHDLTVRIFDAINGFS